MKRPITLDVVLTWVAWILSLIIFLAIIALAAWALPATPTNPAKPAKFQAPPWRTNLGVTVWATNVAQPAFHLYFKNDDSRDFHHTNLVFVFFHEPIVTRANPSNSPLKGWIVTFKP